MKVSGSTIFAILWIVAVIAIIYYGVKITTDPIIIIEESEDFKDCCESCYNYSFLGTGGPTERGCFNKCVKEYEYREKINKWSEQLI